MKKVCLLFFGLMLVGVGLLLVSNVDAKVPHAYYTAGTDTITVVDGNATVPNTMATLYAADGAGGWGQITRISNSMFRVDANLIIGNSTIANTTFFKSIKESIVLEKTLTTNTYCTVQFGDWVSGHSCNGSMVVFNQSLSSGTYYNLYADMYVYGSTFRSNQNYIYWRIRTGAITRINETRFYMLGRIRNDNTNIIYYDTSFQYVTAGIYVSGAPSYVWDKITVTNSADSAISTNANIYGSISVWNSDLTLGTVAPLYPPLKTFYAVYGGATKAPAFEIINPKHSPFIPFIVQIGPGSLDASFVRFNFTLDVLVTNWTGDAISNTRVQIWNKTNTIVYDVTTDANGRISQKMLPVLKCYDENAGSIPRKNITYTPYRIMINKTGYNTYNESFNITAPLNWTIALQNATTTGFSDTSFALGISAGMRMPKNNLLIVGLIGGIMFGFITGFIVIARLKKKKEDENDNETIS